MINWKFIEKNMDESSLRCTTVKQAEDFLKACEEHEITWNSGKAATEYRDWENNIREAGYVYFKIYRKKLFCGRVPGNFKNKYFTYEYCSAPMKDVFISEVDKMLEIYEKVRKLEHDGICQGHGCKNCPMYAVTENNGRCLWNRLGEIIQRVKIVAERHTWPDEKAKELTISEISKLLGYEVKVVKEG